MFVLDLPGPCGHRERHVDAKGRAQFLVDTVRLHFAPLDRAHVLGLAKVVEEETDRRRRELGRPLLVGRIEGDLDSVETVRTELALEQGLQGLVQVGEHGVERDADGYRHDCKSAPLWEPSATDRTGR